MTALLRRLTHPFIAHPRAVGETYIQHFGFALWFAARLGLACGAAVVHALVPALCQKTASQIVKELADRLATR